MFFFLTNSNLKAAPVLREDRPSATGICYYFTFKPKESDIIARAAPGFHVTSADPSGVSQRSLPA